MKPTSLVVSLHIDGGARGNPGPAAAGVVLRDAADGEILHEAGIFLGRATNNVAEYRALLAGLQVASELGAAGVDVFSDSELLVRQMTGQYRVKAETLRGLHEKATGLQSRFKRCTFRHVRREDNTEADRLVNRALNLKRSVEGAAE